MQLYALPDIAGDNANHALTANANLKARAVYLTAIGGPCRLGDSSVNSAQGVQLPQNVPVILVLDGADITSNYPLSKLSAYVPSGTTLTISYGL